MAATDTTFVPVYGQAYRTRFEFIVLTTGDQFSGTLNTLTVTLSKNDGAPVAATNPLTQIGTSGLCYLDLTAAEMAYNVIVATPACGNSGVFARAREIVPFIAVEPTSPNGAWYNALSLDGVNKQIRLENILFNIAAAAINNDVMNSPNGQGQHQVFTSQDVLMLSGTYTSNTSGYANRGGLS